LLDRLQWYLQRSCTQSAKEWRTVENPSGSEIIRDWPEESREAAQLVIDTYGEPQEATQSLLTWHQVGPWKRVLASKVYFEHQFPAPHIDSVESVLDYRVPPEQFSPWPPSTAA
jgi:hypothetical protein